MQTLITVDATVVSSVAGTIQSSHTDTFIKFTLPIAVQLNVGDVFFAGFQSTGFAVGRDETSSAGQSWIFSNGTVTPLDPNTLGAQTFSDTFDNLGFPGNALIRVNAIPEPTSFAMFGIAMIGMARRRRMR